MNDNVTWVIGVMSLAGPFDQRILPRDVARTHVRFTQVGAEAVYYPGSELVGVQAGFEPKHEYEVSDDLYPGLAGQQWNAMTGAGATVVVVVQQGYRRDKPPEGESNGTESIRQQVRRRDGRGRVVAGTAEQPQPLKTVGIVPVRRNRKPSVRRDSGS